MDLKRFGPGWLLLLMAFLAGQVYSIWTEFEMVSIAAIEGLENKPANIDLRVKRKKNGVYLILGNITITAPFAEYMGETKMFYSPNSNNQWVSNPMKVPRGPLCNKVNNEYRKLLMKDLSDVSDLPRSDDATKDLCPMFEMEKTFELKGYEFNAGVFPKYLQAGLYKILIIFTKDGEEKSGIDALLRLS